MITLINAPSILGLRPTGVELLPDALYRAGLTKKLSIQTTDSIPSLPYQTERDPKTHMLNPDAIAGYSVKLADAVEKALQYGTFPLVLGGDCSIVLGNMLALKRKGRHGLFFLDGHADFYQPSASQTGEAADMDLALVSGRGPALITDLEGQKPFVRDKDIVQFGQRDKQETIEEGSQQIADTMINVFELDRIRRTGVEKSAHQALDLLLGQPIEGFWIHIDADVIHDKEMPAVDYRLPGGLTFEELQGVLKVLFNSNKVTGLSLAIYNPKLDSQHTVAAKLVDLLTSVLKAE